MVIKKCSKFVKCKFCSTHIIKGGVIMSVLAKPVDSLFIVKEDKVDDFLNQKRNNSAMKSILEKADKFKKNLVIVK